MYLSAANGGFLDVLTYLVEKGANYTLSDSHVIVLFLFLFVSQSYHTLPWIYSIRYSLLCLDLFLHLFVCECLCVWTSPPLSCFHFETLCSLNRNGLRWLSLVTMDIYFFFVISFLLYEYFISLFLTHSHSQPQITTHLPTVPVMTCLMVAAEQGYYECTLSLLEFSKSSAEEVSSPLLCLCFISPLSLYSLSISLFSLCLLGVDVPPSASSWWPNSFTRRSHTWF